MILPRNGLVDNRLKKQDVSTKKYDRLLTEKFIGGLNSEGMIDEIFREVATLGDIEDATSEHVLNWECRVVVQRGQK